MFSSNRLSFDEQKTSKRNLCLEQFKLVYNNEKDAGTRNYFKIILEFNIIPKPASLSSLQIGNILSIIQSPVISRALQEFPEKSQNMGLTSLASRTFRVILGHV